MNDLIKIDKKRYEINVHGERYKTPVEKRAKKTKFSKIIKKLSDRELEALCIVLFGKNYIKSAVECFSNTVDNSAQLFALEKEYKSRL